MTRSTLMLLAAGIPAAIVFVSARQVFRDHITFSSPSVLAAAVAALAFLGIRSLGEGVMELLLGLYAALAIALLLLHVLPRLRPLRRFDQWPRQGPDQFQNRGQGDQPGHPPPPPRKGKPGPGAQAPDSGESPVDLGPWSIRNRDGGKPTRHVERLGRHHRVEN